MKRFLTLAIVLLVAFPPMAQPTQVSGIVSGAEGQQIRILAFDDFISLKTITLATSKIDEKGAFSLEFDLKETTAAFLDINYQRGELFVEPGNIYQLDIHYSKENQLASYFDRQGLTYELTNNKANELNNLIWKFNAMYNKFVMENFEHIYRLHDRARVAEFRADVDSTFASADNLYFQDFVTYKMADVEQFAKLKGKNTLATEYFTDKPVLYNNIEYTFFFDEFFEKFLITSPDVITISELIITVNDHADYRRILDSLSTVPYLQNKDFRELVLIHSLKGLYHNATYKKTQLLKMLKELNKTTSNPVHKRITANLLETLRHLAPGTPAPDIELIGIAGNSFNLKSIKGKPILLHFFRSGQTGTDNSFQKLAELYNVYRAGIEIISISMDNDPSAYIPLANNGSYHWTFTHYGNDPNIYDLYNIRNLPLYVLIDVEGNIAVYPAPEPGDELEREVMRMMH